MQTLTRRQAIGVGLGAVVATLVPGCRDEAPQIIDLGAPRIKARPGTPTQTSTPGQYSLGLAREAILYVPTSYAHGTPAPLAVVLHGAGGNPQSMINAFKSMADATGLILLACKSEAATWDAITTVKYEPDPAFIDQALAFAFDRCTVDTKRICLEGFSDGATYAIGLGRANGDFFTRIVVNSAGFLLDTVDVGNPVFFVSHGTTDNVLPIEKAREMVTALRRGYTVTYEEFQGGHTIPVQIAQDAVAFMTKPSV